MNRCYYHRSNWIIFIIFFSFTILINAQNTTNWQHTYDTDEYTVALWHFDETAGNIVADAGPNNYDGVSTNTNITISMNGFGNTREFVDNPIGYITFGNFNLPQFEGTLEYWINPSIRPVTGCDHSHFFVKGTHGNAGSGFTFYNSLYNDTDVDFGVGDSGGDVGRRFEYAFNYNEWQHIAFTWTTVETKMYVNGELISVMDPFPIGIGQSNDEVALGKWGSQLYTSCRYVGYIDELRISNIERTFEPPSTLVEYKGQMNIDIKVVDHNHLPAKGVSVYIEDGFSCIEEVTNKKGYSEFKVQNVPKIIYLSDTRKKPKYGVKAYIPNMSAYEYTIEIPLFPRNKKEAIFQLNNFTNVVSTSYGYYSAVDFIRKGLKGSLPGHGLGVPYLFSINPIPVLDKDGRLGLTISGVLVEPIVKFYLDAQNKITGLNFDYYYKGY